MCRRGLVLALALVVAACGEGEATGDIRDVRGTPAKTEGGEAPRDVRWAPVTDARPMRAEDMVIRVIDAREEGRRGRVRVELRNRSSDPIRVAPAWLRLSVFREGLLLRCARSAPRELELEAIGAGESAFTTVSLPCALDEPGTYRVLVVLMTPEPEPDAPRVPADARASGFVELEVP